MDVDYRAEFTYLDDLRESGVVNMMGASNYLVRDFGCSRQEAKDILLLWMKSWKPTNKEDK